MKHGQVNYTKFLSNMAVNIRTVGNVVRVAPRQISLNGQVVATSFEEFKKFCKTWGLTRAQFSNWPFEKSL
jgi:hypothetical protein